MLVGILIVAVSFLANADEFNAPRWVVGIAGSIFFFSGLGVYTIQPQAKGNLLAGLCGAMIVSGFTAICGWMVLSKVWIAVGGLLILLPLTFYIWFKLLRIVVRLLFY